MSRTTSSEANVLMTLKLKSIKPVQRADIPVRRGRGRGTLHNLQATKDFDVLLDYITKRGINPLEIAGEIDLTTADFQVERKNRKSFSQSYRKLLRQKVKERDLGGKIDVIEYDRGNRIFIVGREAA